MYNGCVQYKSQWKLQFSNLPNFDISRFGAFLLFPTQHQHQIEVDADIHEYFGHVTQKFDDEYIFFFGCCTSTKYNDDDFRLFLQAHLRKSCMRVILDVGKVLLDLT